MPKIYVTYHEVSGTKLPKEDGARLNLLLKELCDLHHGILKWGATVTTLVPGGVIPFPQTHPKLLAKQLGMSKPSEWRVLLANEVLIYLEKAYRAGHPEAAPEGFKWCTRHKLPVPDWIRDAPRTINRQGAPSGEQQFNRIFKDLTRYTAIEFAAHEIVSERRKGVRRSKKKDCSRDKYVLAKRGLAGTFADTKTHMKDGKESTGSYRTSFRRFKNERSSYYFSIPTIMTFLKMRWQILYEILS